ncbi:MAG: hypothetical protein LBK63_04455 [Treponema sp.]|nr:hypothetical protein [Treponema sp.]
MKKFAAGLLVFAAGLCLDAQEAPIALPESSWPERRLVTEIQALQDLRGGVYVPYIAEDRFQLLRYGPGEALSPYAPAGFNGASLGARKLKAIKEGPERYAGFIGRQKGGESICLFGFGFWDDLSWHPLPETEAPAITDYALVPSGNGGVTVYTLAEGRLRSFSTGTRSGAPWQSGAISRPGEQVEAFEVIRERDQEISYGWYRVARKDYWEIILFSLNDAGNLGAERTGSRACIPQLAYGVSSEGKAVFVITAGSAVSVYHAEGAGFVRDLYFDAPFKAKGYRPALLTGFSAGLLIGEAEGTEVLYGVSHERSGAPALRELFARPQADILELFFVDHKWISLIYRSNETVGAALIDPSGGVIADDPLPVPVESALLFRPSPEGSRLCALSEADSQKSCVLSVFEFAGETWRSAGTVQLPRFIPEEVDFLTGIRKDDLLLMASPEALMLLDIESSEAQTLEAQNYDRTGALNGVVYLAVSSEDGIDLFRIEE